MEARAAEDPAVRGLTDWLLRRRQHAVQISAFIPVTFMIFTSWSGDFQVMLEGFLECPGKISESGAPLQRASLGEQESPLLTCGYPVLYFGVL